MGATIVKLSIKIDREEDGRWIAEVREVSGALAYGQTREAAMQRAASIAFAVLDERPTFSTRDAQNADPLEAWRQIPPHEMVLRCPKCGKQHLDFGEFETRVHRKHLCRDTTSGPNTGCGHLWAPFPWATKGVEEVPTLAYLNFWREANSRWTEWAEVVLGYRVDADGIMPGDFGQRDRIRALIDKEHTRRRPYERVVEAARRLRFAWTLGGDNLERESLRRAVDALSSHEKGTLSTTEKQDHDKGHRSTENSEIPHRGADLAFGLGVATGTAMVGGSAERGAATTDRLRVGLLQLGDGLAYVAHGDFMPLALLTADAATPSELEAGGALSTCSCAGAIQPMYHAVSLPLRLRIAA